MKKLKRQLRNLHRKQVRGRDYSPGTNAGTYTCDNCGNTFTGNFCNLCGQTAKVSRFTFRSGIQTIFSDLTSLDRGFVRTLGELIYRPGYLISDYIAGKRVRYFRPFQMLFILAATYLLLVQILDPGALEQMNETAGIAQNPQTTSQTGHTPPSLKMENREIAPFVPDSKNPDDLKFDKNYQTLRKRISESPIAQTVFRIGQRWSQGNKAATILCIIPLFAIGTRLSFRKASRNRHYNLTEQVVVQTYIACLVLLISLFIFLFREKATLNSVYDTPGWIVFLLYLYIYKQLFGDNWWKTFYRTLLMLLYGLLIFIVIIFIIATTVVFLTTLVG